MLKKLFQWLGRYRIIMDRENGEAYQERYYLFLRDRKNFPFNIFLHKFLKGDPADVHNHPWSYRTVILWGGYYECIPIFDKEGRIIGDYPEWRGPGYTCRYSADSYHRIELKPGVTCWTLFMPGRQEQEWGFMVDNNWIQHEQYFLSKQKA